MEIELHDVVNIPVHSGEFVLRQVIFNKQISSYQLLVTARLSKTFKNVCH